MPTTLTQIANSALVKLGQASIMSIDDATPNARTIKSRIDFVLRIVLRLHPWNCAIDRVLSAPIVETPAFEFSYFHQLPTNCVRILSIGPEGTDYKLEGRRILTDSDSLEIKFVKVVSAIEDLDDLLAEAVACYLAWDCCEKITGSTEQRDRLKQDFRSALGPAKSVDAQEDGSETLEANLFLESRI